MRFIVLWGIMIAALLLLPWRGGGPVPQPDSKLSPLELQEDFAQFQREVLSHHPLFFTDRDELDRAFRRHYALLTDSMTVIEFMRVLAPAAARVKCGHTRLYLPEALRDALRERGNYLPLDVKVIDDSLFVQRDLSAARSIEPGCCILAIDGLSAADIIRRIKNCLPADGDNQTYKYDAMNRAFASLYLTFIDAPDSFELTIMPAGAGSVSTTVQSASLNRIAQIRRERYPASAEHRRLGMSFADDNRYAVLTIPDFGYYGHLEEFREPVGEFFANLERLQIGSLILDLRGNDGGDPYCAVFLIGHLIDRPVPYFAEPTRHYDDLIRPGRVAQNAFDGRLLVLIDGGCFSTTGHLCALLKYHRVGTFIGCETGGSFACNDASRELTLKHSRILVNLPHETFAVAVGGLKKGRGIMPDIPVQSSIFDLIERRDAVLEAAVAATDSQAASSR